MAVLLKSKKCYGKITSGKEVYGESSEIWAPKGSILSIAGFGSLPRIYFRFEMIIQEVFRIIQNIQRSLAGLFARSFEGRLSTALNC